MVCRTGLHTAMGGMIRQLLAPTKQHQDKDSFLLVGSFLAKLLADVGHVLWPCVIASVPAPDIILPFECLWSV